MVKLYFLTHQAKENAFNLWDWFGNVEISTQWSTEIAWLLVLILMKRKGEFKGDCFKCPSSWR